MPSSSPGAGAKLPLPKVYTGVVVAQQQREPEGDEPPSTHWAATHTFSEVHYWNHDTMPLKGDSMRRCLEWAQLAAQVRRAAVCCVAAGSAVRIQPSSLHLCAELAD